MNTRKQAEPQPSGDERLRLRVIEYRRRGDAVSYALSNARASKFLTNEEREDFARLRRLRDREGVTRDLAELDALNRAFQAFKNVS